MTEDQIERIVESKMDRLDRDYLANRLTSAEYDAKVSQLKDWADTEIRRNKVALFQMS